MKRIGIIGGLSAESTAQFYYKLVHAYVDRFGNTAYPEILIFSVTFQKFWDWSKNNEWLKFAEGIVEGVRALEAGGADFGLISANMPHIVFDEVQSKAALPLLHIADIVAEEAKKSGLKKVGLMGTIPTMQAEFYPRRLSRQGIDTVVPDSEQQTIIQDILEWELFLGITTRAAELQYINIIQSFMTHGAEAVILGCTEIPMIINSENSPLPLLDSEELLVQAALRVALS